MADFLIAYGITNKNEGFYANVVGDRGGRTYLGISQVMQPSWVGWDKIMSWIAVNGEPKHNQDLGSLIQGINDDAANFYRAEYWNPIRGDEMTSQDWGNNTYDTAVNQGVVTAIHIAQDSLSLSHTNVMDDNTLQTINRN